MTVWCWVCCNGCVGGCGCLVLDCCNDRVGCIPFIVHCDNPIHCAMYPIPCAMYPIHCTLYPIHCSYAILVRRLLHLPTLPTPSPTTTGRRCRWISSCKTFRRLSSSFRYGAAKTHILHRYIHTKPQLTPQHTYTPPKKPTAFHTPHRWRPPPHLRRGRTCMGRWPQASGGCSTGSAAPPRARKCALRVQSALWVPGVGNRSGYSNNQQSRPTDQNR